MFHQLEFSLFIMLKELPLHSWNLNCWIDYQKNQKNQKKYLKSIIIKVKKEQFKYYPSLIWAFWQVVKMFMRQISLFCRFLTLFVFFVMFITGIKILKAHESNYYLDFCLSTGWKCGNWSDRGQKCYRLIQLEV